MNDNIKDIIGRLDAEQIEYEEEILRLVLRNANKVLTVEDIEHIEKLRNELRQIQDDIDYLIKLDEEKKQRNGENGNE